ncbi:MAG: hypothetical protein ACREFY_12150, partial [Acetobacteraceae bacterium]
MDFRAPAARFPDASIDVLHIGRPCGGAVVRDGFEAWLAKLSERAVVLLHGIGVCEPGSATAALWGELRAR